MSCNCNNHDGYTDVCRQEIPYPQVSHESVPSLIDNLVAALYGAFYNPQTQTGYIQKSVVNGRIVWDIPCDPSNTTEINGFNRFDGEGLMCYLLRYLNSSLIVPRLAQAPASPLAGQLYFNTGDLNFYGWNGSEWLQLNNSVE